jgi:hypothetical protein
MGHWWNDTDRKKTEVRGEKPIPVPVCPSQIPHELAWNKNRAYALR